MIIERTGAKLQDLLTRSDPWKGSDCQRQNCLLCFTKNRKEKLKTQDCHKRNIVYETRCITCQENEQDRIDSLNIEQDEKLELKKNIKLFKYIGETSRSSFERGWEHINNLAQLKTSSHMLKHILTKHPDQDMEQVTFGMKIIRTCKSSFERQIYESVSIQHERKEHIVLNSRSEYNRCSLPRLSAQIGDKEYEEYSKELEMEKEQEEKLEQQIKNLRKQRNKARLLPAKEQIQGTKRRKIDHEKYVTIQEIWAQPETPSQTNNKAMEQPQENAENEKMEQQSPEIENNKEHSPIKTQITQNYERNNIEERLNNCRRIQDKVMQGNPENQEWEQVRDWEQMLAEMKQRLELEERNRIELLELQNKKKQGWELYKLCKSFLEQNDDRWNKRKEKEQEEKDRIERLEKAMQKGTLARQKLLEKEQERRIRKLPREIQLEMELEQRTEETKELKRAKESLWKLRKAESKLEQTQEMEQIKKLEKKTEQVTKTLEQHKKMLMEQEQRLRTTINTKNKNNIKNEKKRKKLGVIWTTSDG